MGVASAALITFWSFVLKQCTKMEKKYENLGKKEKQQGSGKYGCGKTCCVQITSGKGGRQGCWFGDRTRATSRAPARYIQYLNQNAPRLGAGLDFI
jgi:hypothetical protein